MKTENAKYWYSQVVRRGQGEGGGWGERKGEEFAFELGQCWRSHMLTI